MQTAPGGPGTTLEMHVFCRIDLIRELSEAGFDVIQVMDDDAPDWRILYNNPLLSTEAASQGDMRQ